MCDTSHTTGQWRLYLRSVVGFGDRVLSYSAGMDQESLVADGRTNNATLRNVKLIGEAATHIPTDVYEAHPEIPRYALIQTRERLG